MQGSDYIFALQDKDYNFWKVDSSGMFTKSARPYFLQFSPAGWEDVSISNVRNKKYWGIDRSVTIPLSYVNDGAGILKYIFYTLGIEESVYLVIANQQLDYTANVSYGYWYKQIFRGEVDLSTFQHAGAKITCTTLEDGLPKFLKANENTSYEFPMNVPEAVIVKMDGINLHEKLNYQETSDLEIHLLDNGDRWFTPSSFINAEGDSVGILTKSQTLQAISGTLTWDDVLALDNFCLQNVGTTPVTITISGKIQFRCTDMISDPAYAVRFRFLRSNQLLANQNDYQIFSTGLVVGNLYTHDYTMDIPLQPNEKLFLEAIYFGGVGTDAAISFTENSKFSTAFITRQQATYIRAFRLQYLWSLIVGRFTEDNFSAAVSSYLALHANKVITSGNAIRGFDDATMQISVTILFKFMDSFDSVGFSQLLDRVNFDRKQNLIDNVNFIDLPEPAADSLKVSVAKEYLFNELEIGYPEIKNDVGILNGNEEFNTKFSFSLGTTKSPAKMDKISPIKASCYEIEKIRVTTLDKNTTDYKADNDLFVLHIEDEQQPAGDTFPAYYNLNRDLNGSATGLIEPATVFNLELSPKRNFLRNGPFFRSSLYLMDNKTFVFINADRNNKLACGGIVEKENVNVGSLGNKFFVPVLFDLGVNVPDDLLDLLDINPLQLFRFPFRGDTYTALLVTAGISPSNRKQQQYQLLSTADNDLSKLIEYYGE